MSTLRAVELIKTAAENITGFTFITGTRLLNNIEADDQRLPLIMLVRPLSIPVTIASGGRLRDSYQCLVIFASKSELEYQFDLHEPIVGDMRLAADQFFVNLNSFSDYVQSISSITYADYINDFDANLTGVAATFTLELIPLDEQVCPTGTFVPEDLPPFSRYLTEVAVDGVTITGNGTTEDPLVALGGGGGGGSLRVQDEGTTVTNAATTLNFTGNVTASLASAGNVTVNVPAETPQVNADWNASSGVAQILNKPTLATVATSGSYTDLINQPSIPPAQVNSDWNAVSGVAEILNKPSIPAAQIQSDWNQANNAAVDFIKNKPTIPSTSGLVPYTGATQDVDLGVNGLTTHDLNVSHPSGSGVAASITKGGAGEALTVVKTSGSGNAASITGGVTLISELHLTTDLADAYIASAATWNAKQNALVSGSNIKTINGASVLGSGNLATPFELVVAASDESTALTTGTAKITFRMPRAVTLTSVRASLTTAQASGNIFTVDINEGGTSILSTKLTIDNTEKTSTTAATPPVISDANLADDAEMTIDIDQIGNGTATGLKVYLIGTYA
jgi:hypothetical protein